MSDVTKFIFEERSRDPLLLTWYRYIRVLRKTIGVMDEYLTNQGMSRYQFDLLMQIVAEDGVNQRTYRPNECDQRECRPAHSIVWKHAGSFTGKRRAGQIIFI